MGVLVRLCLSRFAVFVCAISMSLWTAFPSHAQVIRQLTDYKTDGFSGYWIDDGGNLAVAVSKADPQGTNPEHAYQIIKWELPSGTRTQVTSFAGGVNSAVTITDDGQTIAFDSTADPIGQNPDRGSELFLIQSDGSGLVQLTSSTSYADGDVWSPVISGSGNRVLFLGTIDPFSTNPDHKEQLFIANTSSLGINQLTSAADGSFEMISISDDGERIVFSSSADLTGGNVDGTLEIFRVDADGQNLVQLTDSISDDSQSPMICGDGSIIVFESNEQIYIRPWTAPSNVLLVDGNMPSITDDGLWIYYRGTDVLDNDDIYKIMRSGGSPTNLTASSHQIRNSYPIVSGLNGRLLFRYSGGEYPGGDNPDHGSELMTTDTYGDNALQLTSNVARGSVMEPDITQDGSRIVYVWSYTIASTSSTDLFVTDADGGDPIHVSTGGSADSPTITADGQTIVFRGHGDLAGLGCDGIEVFRIEADGTGLVQLPEECLWSYHPVVSAGGHGQP